MIRLIAVAAAFALAVATSAQAMPVRRFINRTHDHANP